MDTVLGLSLISTSVGWILVEGRDADGAILDHDDFEVPPAGGVQAVHTSEQAAAAVLDAQAAAAEFDQRVHVVGVTWGDEAAAEAALLMESLSDEGYDNVIPIRLRDACDMLARAIAPVVGYDRTAVCVRDGDATIVVMVDAEDGEPQTAVKQLSGGPSHLVRWLTALFERSSWQPGAVVVVGEHEELEALSGRLDTLPVPVITQAGVESALARGAALVSAHSTEFTDPEMLATVDRRRQNRDVARQRPYAGAVTMLAAGAVTFVASLSLALGPHLMPDNAPDPVRPVAHGAARAPIVDAPAPPPVAVKPPPPAPKPEPTQEPIAQQQQQQPAVAQAPVEVPAVAPVAPPAPPPPAAPPPPPEQPPNPHPLLTRLLQRLHGQDPDQPPPPPPPPPGVPVPVPAPAP